MKKKILFIMHFPPPVGGQAMMGKFIKESSLINSSFDCTYINLSTSTTIESIGKNSIKKYIKLFSISFDVLRALIKNNYDLCYVTPAVRTPAFYKDFFVIIFLKFFKRKILYHLHNRGVSECNHNRLNKSIYKYAFIDTKVILLSKLLYPDIAEYVKFENVYLCWNGIPVNKNIGEFPLERATNKEKCHLLFLSNIIIEKGVFVLLDACKILKDRGVEFECNFVGHWAEVSEVDFEVKITEMGLKNYVKAHGRKYGEEKAEYFAEADIFVFPTYFVNETFGLVNLEAMQFGLPIISTQIGGVPDVVINNETGFLIPPQDVTALVDKLELLISNPDLRRKMGDAGKSRFETFFTVGSFEKNMTSILADALVTKAG